MSSVKCFKMQELKKYNFSFGCTTLALKLLLAWPMWSVSQQVCLQYLQGYNTSSTFATVHCFEYLLQSFVHTCLKAQYLIWTAESRNYHLTIILLLLYLLRMRSSSVWSYVVIQFSLPRFFLMCFSYKNSREGDFTFKFFQIKLSFQRYDVDIKLWHRR